MKALTGSFFNESLASQALAYLEWLTTRATLTQAPGTVLVGTTTGYSDTDESLAWEFGIHRIFRKPIRVTALAHALFEAALDLSLKAELAPSSCPVGVTEAEV